MTVAVLSAAGVFCVKNKQNVAKWRKISAKWCCFGLAGFGIIKLRKRYDNDILAFSRIARLSVWPGYKYS
jgi:hypothetical protein